MNRSDKFMFQKINDKLIGINSVEFFENVSLHIFQLPMKQ